LIGELGDLCLSCALLSIINYSSSSHIMYIYIYIFVIEYYFFCFIIVYLCYGRKHVTICSIGSLSRSSEKLRRYSERQLVRGPSVFELTLTRKELYL